MTQADAASSRPHRQEARRLAAEAVKLFNQGQIAQSLGLFRRSIELDSGVASIHQDLGAVLLALGQFELAIEPLRAAIALDPTLASAHFYLGHAQEMIGQRKEAIAALEAGLKLQPGHAVGRSRLADLHFAAGRRTEAASAYRALAEGEADPAKRLFYEARASDAEGDSQRAIAAMRRLADRADAEGSLLLRFAWMLAQAGQIEDAEGVFLRALASPADLAAAWYGYSTIHRFTAADQAKINQLNAALTRPRLTPLERQLLHFALGKAHEDLGQFAVAMRNFDAANGLLAKRSTFNQGGLAHAVDRIIAGPTRPAGWVGSQDPTPVLIVGMPRSGTTLVEQILSSHPEVAAGGEMSFWQDRAASGTEFLNASESTDLAAAADYIAALRAISPTAARVTDKMPSNFSLLGFVHRILSRATLIHCRRHPIDTCLSIFTTNFQNNLDYASSRRSLVAYHRQYERLMDHWRAVLPPDRFVEVRYEDLVADPEPHARRLVAACGLAWDEACLAPHLNRRPVITASLWQARQPIYQSSVERWRRYEPWLGELRALDPDAAGK